MCEMCEMCHQIDKPKFDIQYLSNKIDQFENKLSGFQLASALEENIIEERKRKDKSHFLSGRRR